MMFYFLLIFLMSIIEAIAGFGSISIGVPILAFAWGAETSIAIFTAVGLFMLLIMIITQYKKIDFREFSIILFSILPILPIGYLLFAKLRSIEWALRLIIGILVTTVSARAILQTIRGKADVNLTKLSVYSSLIIGAILQGMFSMGAPLINVYALNRMKDKSVFRATMASVWLITNIITTFYRAFILDIYDHAIIIKVVYALPLIAVAFVVGNKLHYRIPDEKFVTFVHLLQLIAGLISIGGGIGKLI